MTVCADILFSEKGRIGSCVCMNLFTYMREWDVYICMRISGRETREYSQ